MPRCVAMLALVLFVWTVGARADTWTPDNGNGTYTNPLFYDEFSDPDMIRVGEDFYLTGTTMHSMPGLPILHSKDLVNWKFVSYAARTLDLGPSFRLEGGGNIYGQGFWAPSFRYRDGTFYIFSNVNKQATQLFTATNPAGPWRQQSMRRSLHDLSVLFDDDGKAYVVWGYRSIQFAQLTADLTDIVPGTQREIIAPDAGMGEGLHFYKIDGKYFITSAWYDGRMRMPAARADRPEGPYEVNQAISIDEDFGLAQGYRLSDMRGKAPPYDIRPGDPHALGRLSLHQGGVIQTSRGEWWGYSMMDYNSVGRLTALSPVTWKDGWPYFGLPGNLGRTPRTWVKPKTAVAQSVSVPYERDDDFSGSALEPIWQWNHVPVDDAWSLSQRKGYLRLHALPATSLWDARNTLTQRSIGPRSAPSVLLDTDAMLDHDVAGLALFSRPYAWLGVQRTGNKRQLIQFDEQTGRKAILDLPSQRVWLRAECDFLTEQARFSYSLDGERFVPFGEPLTMVFQLTTFQGVRYALFSYNTRGQRGGAADFDNFEVAQPAPRGLMRPIPYRERILLTTAGQNYGLSGGEGGLAVGEPRAFEIVDMQLGRVALELGGSFVSVEASGAARLTGERPGLAETFQWIETPTGELVLMSLRTHRFLRIDPQSRRIVADSPGPLPDGSDGVRWAWAKAHDDPLAPTSRWSAYAAGRAQTPPMGWSSWNAFATDIDEDKILGSAQALVDSGLARKGYRYVNIDDGWWLQRRASDGQLVIRSSRFPSTIREGDLPSFRPFTDRLHAMGLKAGIYSDLGRNTCSQAYSPDDSDLPKGSVQEREVGLYGHIDQDISLFFSDWGFDFIKVDGCGLRAYSAESDKVRSGAYREFKPLLDMDSVARSDIPAVQSLFRQIDAALIRNNPDGDFLLSLCIWGAGNVRAWGKDFGNISRTSDDINPTWGRLLTNFDSAAQRAFYAHPGSWNDPDMLFIGKGDFDADHVTEARSHLSMWAMINAPLMIGMDLRQAPPALLDIFGNEEVLAVNQDPAGHQAVVAFDSEEVQIFVKTLSTADKAVAIFNRSAGSLDVDLTAAHMKFRDDSDVALVDLWNGRKQSFRKQIKLHLEGHQTLVFKARGARVLADGMYLSEQPGNVNPAVDGVVRPAPDPTIHRSAFGWQGTRGSGERPIYAGWGGAQPDSAPYGEALRIGGKKFETGIGVLANSRLEVRNRGYRRFTATVGVNDSARDDRHAVTFTVYGDGKLLATSRALQWGEEGQRISVDVSGVKIIELVARAAIDDPANLPVTWAEAALLFDSNVGSQD